MRLLLAARLSRIAEGQTGIETQDQYTREWAERSGHTIVHVAADKKTGTSQPWERKNLRPWVTEPDKLGQYDAVVAHRLDRLSRGDDESTSAIEDWARRNGKLLLTEDGLVYPCEGADGIRWDVAKRIAHEEWLKTSERYRRMQAHLRDNKFLVGDKPFGYRIICAEGCDPEVKDCGHHKTLGKDPATAPYALAMAQKYVDGWSLPDLCRWLDAEGVAPRHGGQWWPTGVRAILSNEALIGKRRHKGGSVYMRFAPILDEPTWVKLQDRLKDNPRRSVTSAPGLLTGLIHCGLCGRLMHNKLVYTARKDGSKSYLKYYRCDGSPRERSTCRNMIRQDFADESLSLWVVEVIGRAQLLERKTTPGSGHDEDIRDVKQDIRELDVEAADYDTRLSSLRSELARLKSLPAEPAKTTERPTGLTVAQYWDALAGEEAKRRFLLAGKVRVLAVAELRKRKGTEPRELGFSVTCLVGGDWTWR